MFNVFFVSKCDDICLHNDYLESMKKTNLCMHRIIKTKPSFPWNSEKASTFWFPKFLTVTFMIHHPKHTSPKNWTPIQKRSFHAGAYFQIMSFQIRNNIWFGTSQAFPILPVTICLGFPGSFRHPGFVTTHFAVVSKALYWRRSSNPLASSSFEDHSWDSIDHTVLPYHQRQTMGKSPLRLLVKTQPRKMLEV